MHTGVHTLYPFDSPIEEEFLRLYEKYAAEDATITNQAAPSSWQDLQHCFVMMHGPQGSPGNPFEKPWLSPSWRQGQTQRFSRPFADIAVNG